MQSPFAALPVRTVRNPLHPANLSIRSKILLALLVVVLLMSGPYVFLILPGLQYKQQYDRLIQNITTANSINSSTKQDIDAEMWDIITGKQSFAGGQQYAILAKADASVRQMQANTTSARGQLKLRVIERTLNTLRADVDRMGVQLAAAYSFDDNLLLLEKIRDVSQLVEDDVQDYALFEVGRTQQEYIALQASFGRWAIGSVAIIAAAIIFSIAAAWRISRGIYAPIKRLHDITTTIARQDLEVLVTSRNADEMTELVLSFNGMVSRIRELLDAKVKEQEDLKKAELRALQAQINPHFLYNTLDTIIWMAESKRTEQVVDLVAALSRFFRITLSKGKDWISLGEEVEHIASYLAIQKIRYRDILDFSIAIPEDLRGSRMLKLTVQPLVENALYHGIKNKRSGGSITVRGRREQDRLVIDVEDNGIGIPTNELVELQMMLGNEYGSAPAETGYGLHNVNQRIKLYYGQEYGVQIRSTYQAGTCVTVQLPIQRQQA